jgi:hypothetical protein
MNIKTFLMTCGLAVCLLAQPAVAGPLEDGQAAYHNTDYATALKLLRPLAEQGNSSAQQYLGVIYYWGKGVPKDNAEAAKWYRPAADQGDASAQFNLGKMYASGRGTLEDYVQAHMWFNLAAAGGDTQKVKTRDEFSGFLTLTK